MNDIRLKLKKKNEILLRELNSVRNDIKNLKKSKHKKSLFSTKTISRTNSHNDNNFKFIIEALRDSKSKIKTNLSINPGIKKKSMLNTLLEEEKKLEIKKLLEKKSEKDFDENMILDFVNTEIEKGAEKNQKDQIQILEQIQKVLNNLEEDNKSLVKKNDQKKEKIKKLENNLTVLNDKFKSLQKAYNESLSKNDEANLILFQKKKEKKLLESEINLLQSKSRRKTVNKEIEEKELSLKVEYLINENSNLKNEIQNFKEDLKNKENIITELNEELTMINTLYHNLMNEFNKIKDRFKKLLEEKEQITLTCSEQIDNLKEVTEKKFFEEERLKMEHRKKIQDLEKRIEGLKKNRGNFNDNGLHMDLEGINLNDSTFRNVNCNPNDLSVFNSIYNKNNTDHHLEKIEESERFNSDTLIVNNNLKPAEHYRKEINELKKKIFVLENQLEEFKNFNYGLNRDNSDLVKKTTLLLNEINILKEENNFLQSDGFFSSKSKKKSDIKISINSQEFIKKIKLLEDTQKNLKLENNDMIEEIKKLKKEKEELEDQIISFKLNNNEELMQKEKKILKIKREKKYLEIKIETYENKIKEYNES